MKLKLADDLSLPATAVTQTFGVLAVRGAGKSNTAAVMAEEMFDAGLPFVVIDPVGSWYGLRSSADGKAPGLPIPIFGGKHGDLPLERGAGELLADLVVGKRLSCVLDLSTFESEAAKKEFLLAFARRLYLRNEDPLHLFLEEADDYIPQKPMRDEAQLLRAWENIVRRGRARGLGITLITQRSAAISKSVLTQIETLFAMRTTSPQDRAAIEAWVKYHQVGAEVLESLASLKDGEAWVWSPHFLGAMTRVQVRRRRTYDSGATPKNLRGDQAKKAATLADVDLEAVKVSMAATIEKAKAEDPRELRKQLAEAHRMLVRQEKTKCVLKDGQLARAEKLLERMDAVAVKFSEFEEDLRVTAKEIRDAIASTRAPHRDPHATTPQRVHAPTGAQRSAVAADHSPGRGAVPAATASRPAPRVSTQPAEGVTPAQQRILNALAFFGGIGLASVDKVQLSLMVGVPHTSGGYKNNLGALRTAGLIAYPTPGDVALTDAGAAIAQTDGIPQTSEELHDAIRAKLPPAKWKLLEQLIAAYPDAIDRSLLAQACQVPETSGGFKNNLGALRTLGLIDYPHGGVVAARPVLFLEER